MNKPSINQLRDELRSLTGALQQRGVSTLAYPADMIDRLSLGTLVSCIAWAQGTIHFIENA
jgi:hypothetical protein